MSACINATRGYLPAVRTILVGLTLLLGSPFQPSIAALQTDALQGQGARNISALDVSIVTFDPGVPSDSSVHSDLQVFPRIRRIEAMFLPFVLRETLVETQEWGAVRVVPERDDAAELLVAGQIVRSDGETLELKIRVVDASGRVWLERNFSGTVTDNYARDNNEPGVPGYQRLYDEIANELLLARARYDNRTLTGIAEISLLRYANQLAPSAFGHYLEAAPDGSFTINSLPARNDPMLERIERIRRNEYVITDTVDAKFRELHAEIASTYDVWREYRRKSVEYRIEDARRAESTQSDAPRGSYEAMKNLYDNYKFDRITAQEKDRLAVAFSNEVTPAIEAMEARVADLQAWVDEKYAEWHRLLEELHEVDLILRE